MGKFESTVYNPSGVKVSKKGSVWCYFYRHPLYTVGQRLKGWTADQKGPSLATVAEVYYPELRGYNRESSWQPDPAGKIH